MYMYICICIRIYVCVRMLVCIYHLEATLAESRGLMTIFFTKTQVCKYTCICMCTCLFTYMNLYTCMYVIKYISVYVSLGGRVGIVTTCSWPYFSIK